MYHSFLIHSFTDGHLGCFQHLAIVNCAAVNIEVYRFFYIGVSGFLEYNPSSGIAGSKGSDVNSFFVIKIKYKDIIIECLTFNTVFSSLLL